MGGSLASRAWSISGGSRVPACLGDVDPVDLRATFVNLTGRFSFTPEKTRVNLTYILSATNRPLMYGLVFGDQTDGEQAVSGYDQCRGRLQPKRD